MRLRYLGVDLALLKRRRPPERSTVQATPSLLEAAHEHEHGRHPLVIGALTPAIAAAEEAPARELPGLDGQGLISLREVAREVLVIVQRGEDRVHASPLESAEVPLAQPGHPPQVSHAVVM